uniref:Uncharacterized protein n=1 Tax=Siphoviridae sp. ctgN495 TaxID=2825608 RepID=A0A8S5UD30_9CAUD|nr:MAG TPA: hypothetical protein [Siphoviridae sp. ctgN495]
MPTAKNEVKLKFGTKAKYTSATKNADTVYFITDTNQIFVGSSLVSSKCYYVTASPVESNYGVGDVVVWKLSDNAANICVVNSSGQFDTFTISIPNDEITANTKARHSHKNKEILDAISGTPVQVTSQTLTDAQKTQARTNIGALGTVVPNPTNDNDAANKAYVDSKVSSGGVTVDPSLSDKSTNPVQNKVVKAAIDGKSSVTIKSWTIDDVGGIDVTLASGTTYIIDNQSLGAIAQNIEAPDGKIIIELPSAILADDNGQIIIQEPTKLYLGYGYNALGDRIIYVSKFNPTNLLGSEILSVEFTYPYIEYTAGDVSGTSERMKVQNTINSNSTINYAQVQILSNVTISSKQNQMLFQQ